LVSLLAVIAIVIWFGLPSIRAWMHPKPPPRERIANENKNSSSQIHDELLRRLKAKEEAEAQARLAMQNAASKPPASTPPTAPPPVVNAPPIVQAMPASPRGAPARALPLDPNKLDTERIAAYQVALERIHFSCGFVDGDQGMRTQRMLRAFQTSRGLPVTGFLDPATRAAIGEPGEPFLSYVVTPQDIASIMPKPNGWLAKAHAGRLGYNNIWELLAEKFHCTRGYLKTLNRDVVEPVAGTEVIGPKVYPAAPIPQAASLRVNLGETSIEALDAGGRIIAFFPCSIAKDKNKRPNGKLFVKSVVPDPDYTFDPALFADAAKEEGLTKKMVIPPGPRNPVGTAWIGLSLPGYGIHGTPEPENISRTQSHGCFRLANWNADKVLKMVRVGTPVDVEP
jgi:lipoprotein-anchoring transpeptidase ErfK/SrfK